MLTSAKTTLAAALLLLGVAACGELPSTTLREQSGAQQQKLTDPQQAVFVSLGLDAEQVGPEKRTPECLALRVKVATEKGYVRYSIDWRRLERSDAFATFVSDKEKFLGAKCAFELPLENQDEECTMLLNRLERDWEVIFRSREWTAVGANKSFLTFEKNLARAKGIGCFLP